MVGDSESQDEDREGIEEQIKIQKDTRLLSRYKSCSRLIQA